MRGACTGAGLTVPAAFKVNEGGGRVIAVQGPVIRVEPPLRKGRTFFVHQAAGLTVHRPRGRSFENVLFDDQGETLCRFTVGEKNGEVFLQYLRSQGVPFYRPDGQPLEPAATAPEEDGEPIRHTDMEKAFGPRFTLQLRRTQPIWVWIALGQGLGLLLFLFGFPAAAILSGSRTARSLNILLAAIIILIAGPWVLALVRGQLFPPSLTVEGDRMRITTLSGSRELRPEDVGGFCFQRSDECYILYDKAGKTLAKFSTRDDFGPQFLDFLTDHNIPCRQHI